MNATDDLRKLYDGLQRRPRPEDVAAVALRVVGDKLTGNERRTVAKAARWAERPMWWSHQRDDWAEVVGADKQVATLALLAQRAGIRVDACDPSDAADVRRFADMIAEKVGEWDQVAPLGRDARVAHGVPSVRVRDRLRRQVGHLRSKADHLERAAAKRRAAIVGRAGLVFDLDFDTFANSPTTAAFVAYYAARRNLRRQFTLAGKENAFDDVAKALWQAMARNGADWEVVARVYGAPRVVDALDVTAKMRLAGRWWDEMRNAATLASRCAGVDRIRRDRMCVFRGMDSETWNLAAQAYNEARAAWFAAVDAAGAIDAVTPVVCPPKLSRMMAADLVYWQMRSSNELHPDTRVAARLPWPWEVLDGTAPCTADDVTKACEAEQVDPAATGWVGPRLPRRASEFAPTPELVHGIVVGDPMLAALLRRAGVFSGKGVRFEMLDGLDRFGDYDQLR